MMRYKLYLMGLLLSFACRETDKYTPFEFQQGENEIKIELVQQSDSCYLIKASTSKKGQLILISSWTLNYPVYQFDCADVVGNGTPSIAVGVIKRTRFDSIIRKRLFLFKLVDGYVRPLWLGSRMPQPLINFWLDKTQSPARIRTLEQSSDGSAVEAEYRWRKFGLEYIQPK